MQLDALLRSMGEYFTYPKEVFVLFKATDALHRKCYKALEKEHPNTKFVKETNFKEQTESLTSESKEICFLVDDDIFYNKVRKWPVVRSGETVSLRLGSNVRNRNHFNYTISVDGNIFISSEILECMQSIKYSNPNELEGRLVKYQGKFKMYHSEQYLVGIPHNRVSDSSSCKFSGHYNETDLAIRYMEGQRIDYKAMDYSNIGSVHAEIDYKFYEN
jgi:hypothetical protein